MKHFIYSRKSSEDDDRQALSIAAQLSELNSIASRESLSIAAVLTESKSAKEPGREVFNEMLRRIEAGEANAILTWKLDRLARNFDDGGRIIGMLQRGVIQEILTFEKTYLPSDNVLSIAVELGMANQYVRDLSLNIRRGIREKVRRGIFSGTAPLGYFNEPRLRTIEPHPRQFKKLKAIFEEFAEGNQTLADVLRSLNKAGFVGRQNGKPLTYSTIGKILRNPFYCGLFLHKGELHQGIHLPMISKAMFDRIQEILLDVGKPQNGYRKQKGFLFLDFATCSSCGYSITAERHIKKSGLQFHYYRCTHKSKKHLCEDRNYVRQEKFESEVKRNVELVCIPDEWKEKFLARVENWSETATDTKRAQIEILKRKLLSMKSKLERINNAFAEGSLDVDEFKEIKNPLVPKRLEIEQKIVSLETSQANRLEPLRNWILEANQGNQMVASQNWLGMKKFLKRVGSNRLLRGQTLTVNFKSPWNFLAETTLAVRSTGPIFERTSLWWRARDSNWPACWNPASRCIFGATPVACVRSSSTLSATPSNLPNAAKWW